MTSKSSPLVRNGLLSNKYFEEQLLAATPVGRFGTTQEIASCVSWLVSEDAGFVTGTWVPTTYALESHLTRLYHKGQTIGINGGFHVD